MSRFLRTASIAHLNDLFEYRTGWTAEETTPITDELHRRALVEDGIRTVSGAHLNDLLFLRYRTGCTAEETTPITDELHRRALVEDVERTEQAEFDAPLAEVNPIATATAKAQLSATVDVLIGMVLRADSGRSVSEDLDDAKEALVLIGVSPALLVAAGTQVLGMASLPGGTRAPFTHAMIAQL